MNCEMHGGRHWLMIDVISLYLIVVIWTIRNITLNMLCLPFCVNYKLDDETSTVLRNARASFNMMGPQLKNIQ